MSLFFAVGLHRRFRAIRVGQIVAMLILWACSTTALGFSIQSVEASRDADNHVVVELSCDIQLSQAVIDALRSNIPITILTTIKLYRVRANLWPKSIDKFELPDKMTYVSLYRTYRLSSQDMSIRGDYESLDQLLLALCERRTHRLAVTAPDFVPDANYRGSIKIKLDRSVLPSVMRVPVFFKNAWRLQSKKVSFEITRHP